MWVHPTILACFSGWSSLALCLEILFTVNRDFENPNLRAMMPGISCSAISISLRPYTCAEILRTQKSELPWLFVCDVFSLGEAFTQIVSQHRIACQNYLWHLIFVTAWASVRAWADAILGGGRDASTPEFILWKSFFPLYGFILQLNKALTPLLTCTSSSLRQPSLPGRETRCGKCWHPRSSSSSPPSYSPPPASPPPSDGWKSEERWSGAWFAAMAWVHCSTMYFTKDLFKKRMFSFEHWIKDKKQNIARIANAVQCHN